MFSTRPSSQASVLASPSCELPIHTGGIASRSSWRRMSGSLVTDPSRSFVEPLRPRTPRLFANPWCDRRFAQGVLQSGPLASYGTLLTDPSGARSYVWSKVVGVYQDAAQRGRARGGITGRAGGRGGEGEGGGLVGSFGV